jgi:hypothetical protein
VVLDYQHFQLDLTVQVVQKDQMDQMVLMVQVVQKALTVQRDQAVHCLPLFQVNQMVQLVQMVPYLPKVQQPLSFQEALRGHLAQQVLMVLVSQEVPKIQLVQVDLLVQKIQWPQ